MRFPRVCVKCVQTQRHHVRICLDWFCAGSRGSQGSNTNWAQWHRGRLSSDNVQGARACASRAQSGRCASRAPGLFPGSFNKVSHSPTYSHETTRVPSLVVPQPRLRVPRDAEATPTSVRSAPAEESDGNKCPVHTATVSPRVGISPVPGA